MAALVAAVNTVAAGCTQQTRGEFSRNECSNNLDDDGDQMQDCDDPDCAVWVMCSAQFIRLRNPDAGAVPDDAGGGPGALDAAAAGDGDGDTQGSGESFALSAAEAMVPVSLGVGQCLDPCTPTIGLDCYCLPDVYVQIALDGEVVWTSRTVRDSLNPRWAAGGGTPALLALSESDDGRLSFIVKDNDEGELEDGILAATDDLIFECAPSLEGLGAGYLGCSSPPGDPNNWVRVDAVKQSP